MLQTPRATRGMVVAPHHLAAQAGLRVLREGGNAIEAMVAAAATIAVVYPHMNGLGGDCFWLMSAPGEAPVGIDACGAAGSGVDAALYRRQGLDAIPARGPLAAITVPGAVSGWQAALATSARWGGRLPLDRLLEDAIHYARHGVPVTQSQHANTAAKRAEFTDVPGYAETFLSDGAPPAVGALFKQPALAGTLERLAKAGLDDFYRGALAREMAAEMGRVGSPLTEADLAAQRGREVTPLTIELSCGSVYNLPPPTQGLASLMILGLFDRLGIAGAEGFPYLHGLVEATKRAFLVRDEHVTDPAYMTVDPARFLSDAALSEAAAGIDPAKALPWGTEPGGGDTVWLGAIDGEGRAVSFIQSLYWEFGSGVVLRDTGIMLQNRGSSFRLAEGAPNALKPGRKPFHTIQPPLARLKDGRVMSYGTMGGEGQPQTQAAIFTRHVLYGQDLQAAVTAPRWLLGRTWGAPKMNLRIEDRFAPETIDALRKVGHDVELVGPFDEIMGHAGALVRHPSGLIEGASDPRSDGVVAAF
ncbi:gamma-glutamyltransferase family protein [Rhodospirillaceae bacterium SYSU D60014]|uniref:gamma-glutamyltransferase family protein n=1 Tax=Virgifigura deserti TaxID=2268457 RepID=UPI000E6628F6